MSGEQRRDECPRCGTERTELVVAVGRFYCPTCGLAGEGPSAGYGGAVQLELAVPPEGSR